MQTHSAATFDRQTRAVEERQDHEPEESEPEPETYSEHLQSQEKEEEDEDEDEEEGDSRGFGVRCCISTRAGLGVAAVVQLGLSAGSVLTVAPTWPSRPGLLAWQCVVLFAVWLSAAMENRSVATASFVALSAGSAALLALWSTAQPPRLLCEHASQHGCTEGTRDGCCYRCTGFHSAISPSEWEAGCSDRMVVEGKFCWYPEWCDSSAVGTATLFSGAASLNACLATCLCWCQWALLAPRTKEENVEARGRSFAGKSMMQMGKSMSQMPSFLFRPQKGGGAMQQARVAPAPRADTSASPAPAPAPVLPVTQKKKPPKPTKRTVVEESDVEMLARAARLAHRAEDVEKTRQKALEQSKQSRKGGNSTTRNGLEGAAIKISETTGSIIWGGTEHPGELDGGSSSATMKSKKERREKREKRREKHGRHGAEEVTRPSRSKTGSGSKRRPKVGA